MEKLTFNGLKEIDDNFKKSLIKDATALLEVANSVTGHLGDKISALRTTISSIEIKANKLSEIFKKQK